MNGHNVVAKPLTLLKEEFVFNLVELCNNSGLPFFIVESIVKDIIQDIHLASKKQFESDKAQYDDAILKLQSAHTEEGD